MPLVSFQGSGEQTSSRESPNSLRPEVLDNGPAVDGQALIDEKVVNQSLLNNTSINVDAFKNDLSAVAGYPEGRIVKVTYFSQNKPVTDIQSKVVEMHINTIDDVHLSWTEIRNFELRLSSEIAFDYDEESNFSKCSGDALILPGFIPRIGDLFLMEFRNSKIGVCNISSIKRLALGQDTYHQVSFQMQRYLDIKLRDRLRTQSRVVYFEKVKFMLGNHAMLTTEGYTNMKDLQHLRQEIIQNYQDRFYSNEFGSFMRPDGRYDPYVVEYWNKKVSVLEAHQRPIQLLVAVQNYKKTIWSILTGNPIKNLKNISRNWNTHTYVTTFWGTNITSLINHDFITVGDEEGWKTSANTRYSGLMNPTPIFGNNSPELLQAIKTQADQNFIDNRFRFYGPFLPFQQCAPHQHPLNMPDPCDEASCVECEFNVNGKHHPIHKEAPPYPIMSNEELGIMYKRIHSIPLTAPLDDVTLSKIRGYILWYRTTFPGTESWHELKAEWLQQSGLTPQDELTADQQESLRQYVKSYRSQFHPVMTDRELEMLWRIREHIALNRELIESEIELFKKEVKNYRQKHGFPANDFDEKPIEQSPGIGFTEEEIKFNQFMPNEVNVEASGAVMYKHFIVLDATISEIASKEDGEIPPEIHIDPSVPHIFYPRHPKPWHHLHCHSVCHLKCGPSIKNIESKAITYDDSYGLSSEFYLGSEAMSPFERLVYKCITNQEIDPGAVVRAVEDYLDWGDEDAFYNELFAIYLIDKALYWLRFHS